MPQIDKPDGPPNEAPMVTMTLTLRPTGLDVSGVPENTMMALGMLEVAKAVILKGTLLRSDVPVGESRILRPELLMQGPIKGLK